MNTREEHTIAIARVITEAHGRFTHHAMTDFRTSADWSRMLHDATEALHGLSADAQAMERRCNEAETRAHNSETMLAVSRHENDRLLADLVEARESATASNADASLQREVNTMLRYDFSRERLRGDGLAADLAHVIVQRDRLERDLEAYRAISPAPWYVDLLVSEGERHREECRRMAQRLDGIAEIVHRESGESVEFTARARMGDLERARHDLAELRGDYAASEAWRRGANRDLEAAREDVRKLATRRKRGPKARAVLRAALQLGRHDGIARESNAPFGHRAFAADVKAIELLDAIRAYTASVDRRKAKVRT